MAFKGPINNRGLLWNVMYAEQIFHPGFFCFVFHVHTVMSVNTHCPRGWPERSRGRWQAASLRDGWSSEEEQQKEVGRCVQEL